MAGKGDQLKDDFLTCPLCLEMYTEPKMLTCQHTFCLECLTKYMQNAGILEQSVCICPMCKQVTTIPEGNVHQLSNNFLVVGLLQFVSNQHATSGTTSLPCNIPGKKCPACESHNPCDTYCQECQMWLCVICMNSHTRLPATKNHTLLSVDTIYRRSMKKLDEMAEVLSSLSEETDTRHMAILQQSQFFADHLPSASATITSSADRLKTLIDDKAQELLTELIRSGSAAEDSLHKILIETENRKSQLIRVADLMLKVRQEKDQILATGLVLDFQNTLKQIPPLRDMPPHITFPPKFKFCESPSLSAALKADTLGHFQTSSQILSAEYPIYSLGHNFTVRKLTSFDAIFVSGLAILGADTIFSVSGCSSMNRVINRSYNKLALENVYLQACRKPWGAAFSSDHKIVVTAAGESTALTDGSVKIYSMTGKLYRHLASGMSLPRGVAVSNDQVYVCDQEDRCLYVFDYKTSQMIKVLKKSSSGSYLFLGPLHVTINKNSDIVVSDAGQFVKIFSSSFQLKLVYQSQFPNSDFWGITSDREGHIFVADWTHGIHVLSDKGEFLGILQLPTKEKVWEPTAVMVSAETNTIIIGTSRGEVYLVSEAESL